MGYPNDEESHPLTSSSSSSSDIEETLPLYSDIPTLSASDLQPPSAKAPPDAVRDFLVQIMLSRGVNVDQARRVGARWTIGTGKELSTYPVAMYREIFGPEDGWVVYKEVKSLIYAREFREGRYGKWVPATSILLALGLIAGAIGIMTSDVDEVWVAASGVSCVFLLVFIMIMIIFLCENRDAESKAENELKSEWYKVPNNVNPQR